MWTDASGERRVDEKPKDTPISDRIHAIAASLTALDAMGFANAIEKAKHLEILLRQRDYQVLPSIPEPRAIR